MPTLKVSYFCQWVNEDLLPNETREPGKIGAEAARKEDYSALDRRSWFLNVPIEETIRNAFHRWFQRIWWCSSMMNLHSNVMMINRHLGYERCTYYQT